MEDNIIIGIDLAKNVFQLHGASQDGHVLFRKKLSRTQFQKFMSSHEPCLVAMEACASSHYWAREFSKYGHDVRLIPPIYVKPFVKRQKNDAADAEAIVEAVLRPNMSFVVAKSSETQALTMMVRTRDQLVSQRTDTINALRGHMAEFGLIAPNKVCNLERLEAMIDTTEEDLPVLALDMARLHFEHIARLSYQIDGITTRINAYGKSSKTVQLLRTMPGVGPISAMVIKAFAPDMSSFENGRSFAAWLGLIPRQQSSGGKVRLGRTTKMGQKDIRRLLIIGAMSRICSACRRGTSDPWLNGMLGRKPRMVVAIALANKMARQIWAMLIKGEVYRIPGINPV